MTEQPAVAPYGTWSSPITAEKVFSHGVNLEGGVALADRAFWLEGRPAEEGRCVIVSSRLDGSERRDVTPLGFSVRTKVHEYGGGAWWLDGDALALFFVNYADQRLYRQDLNRDDAEPVATTPETAAKHRYADGVVTPDGSTIICVRERHEAHGQINEIVALPVDGGAAPKVIAGGRDFYSNPRVSPDGSRLCWLTWDLPWMPWDGCELWTADFGADATVSNERLVAGRLDVESIWQPEWTPTGELYFVSDRSGWWNLYRATDDGDAEALLPMDAEFGWPHWVFGCRSYVFMEDGRLACLFNQGGRQGAGLLDVSSGGWERLNLGVDAFRSPYLATRGPRLLLTGGSATEPLSVAIHDLSTAVTTVLRRAVEIDLDAGYLSAARPIEFPTAEGRTAFALFYPPANARFEGRADQSPPLIVMSHGGPTAQTTAELNMTKQFFTSRGFAVVDVNYGGSTGYSRDYMLRLRGRWSMVDVDDCINAAWYLADRGDVDGSRLLIRGGSAGGYTTLCALTFHNDFTAGASYYGISDVAALATGGTHKFEQDYESTLIGPWPEAEEEYRRRSPINYIDRIECPMILFQGSEDKVVPPAQSEVLVEALRRKGLPHRYMLFEGEQHGFRGAEALVTSLNAEVSFYAQILGFELGDPIPKVDIENL